MTKGKARSTAFTSSEDCRFCGYAVKKSNKDHESSITHFQRYELELLKNDMKELETLQTELEMLQNEGGSLEDI